MLYVGDSKMEALATRAEVAQAEDYYLLPLSHKGEQGQLLAEQVAQLLADETRELTEVYPLGTGEGVPPKLLAQAWETVRLQEGLVEGACFQWSERLLLVYSPTLAQSGYRGLEQRLERGEAQLQALTPTPGRGKRQFSDLTRLQAEAEAILNKHRLTEYLEVTYQQDVQERQVRAYKNRPARTETTIRYQLVLRRNESAIRTTYRTMGWRLLVTNAPPERLSLAEAVRTYRGSVPTIERDFARLKGRPLGLRPLFVQRDDHVTGLVRLLSLALRILTLMEFVARRSLQAEQDTLAGLYPGNPTQTTSRPTTERLLQAFKGITLSIIDLPGQHIQHVTPLTPLQNRILQLLRLSDSVYTGLALVEPNSS
jgi:transposase